FAALSLNTNPLAAYLVDVLELQVRRTSCVLDERGREPQLQLLSHHLDELHDAGAAVGASAGCSAGFSPPCLAISAARCSAACLAAAASCSASRFSRISMSLESTGYFSAVAIRFASGALSLSNSSLIFGWLMRALSCSSLLAC